MLSIQLFLSLFQLYLLLQVSICTPFSAIKAQDTGLGASWLGKIIVMFCTTLAWLQLLIVILDISLQDAQTMKIIYSIVYIVIFAMTILIMPFISGLYQADDSDSKCKQFLSAFVYSLIISFVWCAAVFISFIWLSAYTDNFGNEQRIPVGLYIYLCQSLVGWILLAINGSLGLIFLPYDLILGFINRPKKLTKQQAYDLKKQIQNRSDQLIQQGQKLQSQQQQFKQKSSQMNFISRRRRQGQIKDLISKFRSNVNKLQQDYQLFNSEIHLTQQNPVIPFLKLIAGIFGIIISLIWIIQLLGTTLYFNQKPAFGLLDNLFAELNNGPASFVSAIIYGFFVLYMLSALIKGNLIFGIRIPFVIQFHPLQINKTYFNSLLFNTSMMLLTSMSILQMSMIAFPTYLSASYIGGIFFMNQVRRLPLFGFLYGDRIYTIVFLCLCGLSIIVMIVKTCRQARKSSRRKSVSKTT